MHRDQAALAQPKSRSVKAERPRTPRRDIFYLDAQALTRDCIAHELARRLPDFNILEHAFVQDLITSEDPRLHTAAVAILYVHADRFGRHPDDDPESSSVANALSVLERVAPEVPRVLLSEVEVPEHILAAFHQHIRGYVPTTLPIDQVAEAIRFVAAGGTFVPQSILSLHIRPTPEAEVAPASPDPNAVITRFSPRQGQVLRMLWKGCSNKLIAYELRMCESTVKVHIRHIMKKLNVSNRTQVVLKTRPQLLEDKRAIAVGGSAGREVRSIEHSPAEIVSNGAGSILLGRLDPAGVRSAS
jgi:DNA-binding NarL/FixJ family response regulator